MLENHSEAFVNLMLLIMIAIPLRIYQMKTGKWPHINRWFMKDRD